MKNIKSNVGAVVKTIVGSFVKFNQFVVALMVATVLVSLTGCAGYAQQGPPRQSGYAYGGTTGGGMRSGSGRLTEHRLGRGTARLDLSDAYVGPRDMPGKCRQLNAGEKAAISQQAGAFISQGHSAEETLDMIRQHPGLENVQWTTPPAPRGPVPAGARIYFPGEARPTDARSIHADVPHRRLQPRVEQDRGDSSPEEHEPQPEQ